jgi:asparagine synthase (glutamine-hydrolysing)
MCGICGLLDTTGMPVDATQIAAMNRRLAHRGPDDCGTRVFGPAGLGHSRLSIIDLTQAGHQPMANEDETLWITYNGELYNHAELRRELQGRHAFRSRCDTEVVLHAFEEWGDDCVRRFDGIFAFAIYDTRRGRLFAARDPIGVKPFYYCHKDGLFAFASEVKALFALGIRPALAKENMAEYLMYGWLAGERTLFDGICSLEPGHTLTVAPGSRETPVAYYSPAGKVNPGEYLRWETVRPGDVVEHCADLLARSVRKQMVSDVPVGTLCSGGVDSSLVTALALQHNPRTEIFHVSINDEPALDEEAFAREVAAHLGVQMHCYRMGRDDFRRALADTIYHSDFPVYHLNSVPMYYVSRVAREHGIKVLLSGEGGDELFGGYAWRYERLFRNVRSRRRFGRFAAGLLSKTVDLGHLYPDSLFRHSFRTTTGDVGNALSFASGFFGRDQRYEDSLAAYSFVALPEEQQAQAAMLTDVREYLEHLLNREDKHTMQASVECRVPLLDTRVVEFAVNLPYRFKIRKREGKWVLKQVAERYLPRTVLYRPKVGFNLPVEKYLDCSTRVFRDGFWQNHFGISPRVIERHCARSNGSFWYGFLTTEIWGRIYFNGDSPESVSAMLAAA